MNANEPRPDSGATPSRTGSPASELDDPRVIQALEEYLEAVESGKKPDRQAFLARHREIAEALEGCLDGMEALEVATASSAAANQAARSGAGGWPPDTEVGDFRILREVGRGGMGIVYEAEQISLGRRIALKALPFAFTLDTRQLQRFKNEARAAAQLHHSHIVPIYSVGCERGVHFYAMQYIEGQTLAEVIQELRQVAARKKDMPAPALTRGGRRTAGDPTWQRLPGGDPTGPYQPAPEAAPQAADHDTAVGPLGPLATAFSSDGPGFYRTVAKLGVQAAEALEHAHAYGVVHRDIKPGNLMVDVAGHLWVTDFGLAQFQGDVALTRTGDLLGTLRYMSPEQALAKRGMVDHRTDVYSLGATLYELLTLEPPYDGRDREELLRQIAFEEPRAPRRRNPNIPADLETIVLKALAKRVEERYPTAQELAEDLRRFLELKPILARRPTLLERAAKWARRHRGVVTTSVLLLLLLVVGLGVSTAWIAAEQGKTRDANQRLKTALREARWSQELAEKNLKEANQAKARAEKSYKQAREAVEFLTQVSEQELADNPFLAVLRRRLLEGALVYYQNFITDRKDDPSSRKELDTAREHVVAILRELYASEEYGRVMFLLHLANRKQVQEDLHLNLSDDQKEKVHELEERYREFGPTLQDYWDLSPEERRKKFQEKTRTVRDALAALLMEGQLRRLKEIALQQRGEQAWTEADVAGELELTDSQKTKISALQAEVRKKMPGPGKPLVSPGEMEKARKAATDRFLAVLTPDQKARWKEMVGPTFQGHLCQVPPGPFGPGPGGRGGPHLEGPGGPPPEGPRRGPGGKRRPPGDHRHFGSEHRDHEGR